MEVRLANVQPQDLPPSRFKFPGLGAHHHRCYQRLLAPEPLDPLPLGEDCAQDLEPGLDVDALVLALLITSLTSESSTLPSSTGSDSLDLTAPIFFASAFRAANQVDYLPGPVCYLFPQLAEFLL